jgi:hypothetical protein
MRRKPGAAEEIDRQLAAYEQQLRRQMLFDEELANLAARQRQQPVPRLLPVLPLGHATKWTNTGATGLA